VCCRNEDSVDEDFLKEFEPNEARAAREEEEERSEESNSVMDIPLDCVPSISWLLVLSNKLATDHSITQLQHYSLKEAILSADHKLLSAFQSFQQTNDKEMLIQTLLQYLPMQQQQQQQSHPDAQWLRGCSSLLSLLYSTGLARLTIHEIWQLFHAVAASSVVNLSVLDEVASQFALPPSLHQLLTTVYNILSTILSNSSADFSLGLYLAILISFGEGAIEEKLELIFILLDEAEQGAIGLDLVYNYIFGLLSVIKLLANHQSLNVANQTKQFFTQLIQSLNNSNSSITNQQFQSWHSNPLVALNELLSQSS
jgi:hypothetical protein